MIDLVLITGFLGAGKTTLLRRLALNPPAGRRLAFVINEFSDLNIDARRLPGKHRLYEVSGGSLFCECRVEDFIASLREIERRLGSSADPLVLIETSGIANPEAVEKLLRDTGLDHDFHICRVVAIIAPYRFRQYASAFPNLEAQIRSADTILLNKVDTASASELDAVEFELRRLNSSAPVVRTEFTVTEADLLASVESPPAREADLEICANPYATFRIKLLQGANPVELIGRLHTVDDTFLRLKGWVRDPHDRVHFLSFSQGRWEVHPEPDASEANHLVLIAPESEEPALTAFIRAQPDLEVLSTS